MSQNMALHTNDLHTITLCKNELLSALPLQQRLDYLQFQFMYILF